MPFSKEIEKARETLESCDFISVRDSSSKEICESWGLRNVLLGADPCFVRDLWAGEAKSYALAEQNNHASAFIIRSWPHSREGQKYLGPLRHAATVLRKKGIKVKFISFDKESDRRLPYHLKGEDMLFWDPHYSEPTDFVMEIVRSLDLVISARALSLIHI